jgi:glycosyltransferase involved in cell wall biosynthesis
MGDLLPVPKISVIIPTMNEERSIGLVIDEVKQALGQTPYEIIVVDTSSKDRTREIAAEKGALIIDEPRRGYGRAYKTGFEGAHADTIATLDADLTYPAAAIPELVSMLEDKGLDFISTNRLKMMEKGSMSAKHRFGNWILSTTFRLLFRIKLKDSQSGMWVFRKSILKDLDLRSDGMSMSEELKIEAFKKFRAAEIPISYRPRIGDVKLSSWKDGFGNLKYLFKKRF